MEAWKSQERILKVLIVRNREIWTVFFIVVADSNSVADNNVIGQHRGAKEAEWIELLKAYEHEIIVTEDPVTQKERRLFICRFENWDKSFSIIWNLLDHVRMHRGVKPHCWDLWGKSFTQMGNFRKHMRTHEDENINNRKKYEWSLWGRRYTEKYNLKVSYHTLKSGHFLEFTLFRPEFHSKYYYLK